MEASETIEKPAKKTYQKHKTEKKVSIVHFLNNKVKPTVIGSETYYPLYVRITKDRKNTTLKSLIWGNFSVKNINEIEVLIQTMELEKKIIKLEMENNSSGELNTFEDLLINYSTGVKEFHQAIKGFVGNVKKEVVNSLMSESGIFPFLKLFGAKKGDIKKELSEKLSADILEIVQHKIIFPSLIDSLAECIHFHKFNKEKLMICFRKNTLVDLDIENYFKNVG